MANPTKETNWIKYLKCKQCLEYKNISSNEWYKHNEWFMWVLWRCKACIKQWRKTEHELSMARKRDSDRYYNNSKRRNYIFNQSWERRIKNDMVKYI